MRKRWRGFPIRIVGGVVGLFLYLRLCQAFGAKTCTLLTRGNLSSNALVLRAFWHWAPCRISVSTGGGGVALHSARLNGAQMLFHDRFNAGRGAA